MRHNLKNIDQFIESVFDGFTPKQRKVITARFGLKIGKRVSLQEIGDELGITRERVRQIEECALNKLEGRVREGASGFLETVSKYLDSVGGVRKDDVLISEVKQSFANVSTIKNAEQKLRLLFVAAGNPLFNKETNDAHAFWYTNEAAKKKLSDFLKQTISSFKNADKQAFLAGKAYLAHCKDFVSCHLISISKHIGTNVFGELGLRAWPEIEPKTIRDKAYLVLRKHNEPLHFEDVAKHILKYGIDKEPAHVQTVHNELIKDQRFVLVGRGVYALREQGYEPGTVREVVARLLKKQGPMHATQVVDAVNKQRILKQNTILLSLQNRRFFKRLDDGRYHVKEA